LSSLLQIIEPKFKGRHLKVFHTVQNLFDLSRNPQVVLKATTIFKLAFTNDFTEHIKVGVKGHFKSIDFLVEHVLWLLVVLN